MKNELWQMDYRTIRGHAIERKTVTRLLKIKGSAIANTYFYHGKCIGWDVDNDPEKVKAFERILGVKCDGSCSCKEVVPVPKSVKFQGSNTQKGMDRGGGVVKGCLKPLSLHYIRKGVIYDQVRRTVKAAMYSLRYSKSADPDRVVGYDVFQITVTTHEKYEQFPQDDEVFGYTAGSYTTEQAAMEKFRQLAGE